MWSEYVQEAADTRYMKIVARVPTLAMRTLAERMLALPAKAIVVGEPIGAVVLLNVVLLVEVELIAAQEVKFWLPK